MAMQIFLTLDGVKGEAQDERFNGWIDVLSWNWGMTQSGTTHMGMGGGGGKVDVDDISLTKYVDSATHEMIKYCCSGEHIASGQLIVAKAGGGAPVDYLKIDMEDIMIASYQTGGTQYGLDRVQESLVLNFRRFQMTYTQQMADGGAGPEGQAGWEIAENRPWG
jgi:type VI secretion system secreted protein Hcp